MANVVIKNMTKCETGGIMLPTDIICEYSQEQKLRDLIDKDKIDWGVVSKNNSDKIMDLIREENKKKIDWEGYLETTVTK